MSIYIHRFSVFIFLFVSIPSFAQVKSNLGFFVGTSYYMGDINPARQFYKPSLAVGGLYRLTINPRQAFRASVIYGSVKANAMDFSNLYLQSKAAKFSASMVDASVAFEFNFFPATFKPFQVNLSPYTFVGIGYEIILLSTYNTGHHFSVPFGTGIKYNPNKKITMGLEWSLRKTFRDADAIDGVENPGVQSLINNKDWYSFAGFFITFRIFDRTGDCPVYQ